MTKKRTELRRYIVMPKSGFVDVALLEAKLTPADAPVRLKARQRVRSTPKMHVLDAIRDDGPKLVEMTAESELSLRLSDPELMVVPEAFYDLQWMRYEIEARPRARAARKPVKAAPAARTAASAPARFAVTVVDADSGSPLRGARAVYFTDFAKRIGSGGKSNAKGIVYLNGIIANQAIDRAFVYGPPGYWGFFKAGGTASQASRVELRKIDPADSSLLLRQLYGGASDAAGAGVVVAVVDSGVDGAHPALPNVAGGLNCVSSEVLADPGAAQDWGPGRSEAGGHGTHVAGIIAGRGVGGGLRGVAPGATIRSYRVFPSAGGSASNYDIAKAIESAIADGCHLINLSLGGGPPDAVTRASIERASNAGVVVVAAAGNDGRQPVSFPAAFPECVAVSAMGRKGSFPVASIGAGQILPPMGGPGGRDFVADFSNCGSQIDLTGPGVEIVATLPGAAFGAMSGTSMAAPAVTGFAARLLATNPDIMNDLGASRSRRLKDLLYSMAKPEGFGREYEGFGLPRP